MLTIDLAARFGKQLELITVFSATGIVCLLIAYYTVIRSDRVLFGRRTVGLALNYGSKIGDGFTMKLRLLWGSKNNQRSVCY